MVGDHTLHAQSWRRNFHQRLLTTSQESQIGSYFGRQRRRILFRTSRGHQEEEKQENKPKGDNFGSQGVKIGQAEGNEATS